MPGSLVFFERKDRLEESLGLALEILGPRKFAICREMTKEHEEFIGADLADYKKYCQNLLGEITVVIGPAETESRSALADAKEILQKFLESGRKPREAARLAARELSGWPSKELYSLAGQFRDGQNNKSRGLHSRPSARLAQLAQNFEAAISIISENGEADAKSMLDVLSLAIPVNSVAIILAKGADADMAVEEISAFLSKARE